MNQTQQHFTYLRVQINMNLLDHIKQTHSQTCKTLTMGVRNSLVHKLQSTCNCFFLNYGDQLQKSLQIFTKCRSALEGRDGDSKAQSNRERERDEFRGFGVGNSDRCYFSSSNKKGHQRNFPSYTKPSTGNAPHNCFPYSNITQEYILKLKGP